MNTTLQLTAGSFLKRKLPDFFLGERSDKPMAKRKQNITSVKYSYVGTDEEFEKFLQALVRDYLHVDTLHSLSQAASVQKVESGAA